MSDIDDELFALAGGDEEAEEGEASSVAPGSPDSLGSGAMDESDSDDDDTYHRDSTVPYPLEGKYIDEADKRRIESLPVLERERILGDRAEESQSAKFNAELARRARERESEAVQTDKRKRKASSIEPDDSQRKSTRPKTRTQDTLEAYKREREQRGQLRQRQDDRRHRRRSSSDSRRHGSDADADGESEVEWDERAARQAEAAKADALPATLSQFEAIRASRINLAKFCFYPTFEDTMPGAFVRIGVGQDGQRRTLYKMAQIKEIKKGKPYVFEGKPGDKYGTDQYLSVQHGSARKEYNFNFVSNSGFTESEFAAYKQSLTDINVRPPNRGTLDKKLSDMKNMENMFWDDAAISAKVAKQNKYAALVSKERAKQLANKPAHVDETAQRLAEINRQNRKANSEQIRKALLEERRITMMNRKKAEKEKERKKAEQEAKAKADLLKVPGDTDALFEGSDRDRSATPAPAKEKEKKTGIPTFRKRKMDDDIISSIDLGIDLEI